MHPLISIGIPAYNQPENLYRALLSVLNQSYKNIEIIISDDASPNADLEKFIKERSINDQRVRFFRQKKNIGSEENFRFVLNQANGKYFAWLAHDDELDLNYCSELSIILDANEDVLLAMSDVRTVHPMENKIDVVELDSIRVGKGINSIQNTFFSYQRSNLHFCLYGLFRTEFLKKIKINVASRYKKYNTGWEYPFLASVSTLGRIVSINKILKVYYFNDYSVYHTEIKSMSTLDRYILSVDLMVRTTVIALSSNFPLHRKLSLGLRPWITRFIY